MHILKIIHGYPPAYNAGSEVYSQVLCEALSASHQVTVFTREEDPYRPDFDIRQIQQSPSLCLYLINMPRVKDAFAHPEVDMALEGLIRDLKPDIAHIGHLNHLSTGLVEVLYKAGIPMIFTLHDFWLMCPRGQFLQVNFAQKPYYRLCEKQEDSKCAAHCYNRFFTNREEDTADKEYWTRWIQHRMTTTRTLSLKVDHFIAPSRYLRDRFIADFDLPPDHISYLDYGFDPVRLSGRIRQPGEPFTFGYIGTHIPAKGVNMLIEAFHQIEGSAQLRIWGRPDGHNTRSLMRLAGQSPYRIEFMGEYVNHDLVTHVFNHIDALVVPSIWTENSPLVIHEAQGCHVPVITADTGGMAEYVHHGVNGLLFPHRNTAGLAEQMQYAIRHPHEMRALGRRGYLCDEEGRVPSVSQHLTAIEALYQRLIQAKQTFNP
jgi:glycosyltransferase involved in cell wall biosynthesis